MTKDGPAELETRKMMATAVRRLNLFEYLIMGATMVLALIGGAIAAFVLRVTVGFPFWITWTVASLTLFILPGGAAYLKQRAHPGGLAPNTTKTDDGNDG